MIIGRVIGDVVASEKHPAHEGLKALLVQPLDLEGNAKGDPLLAMDAVCAGIGERVLVVQEGWAAMTAVGRPQTPIDMAIIGVIDEITLDS